MTREEAIKHLIAKLECLTRSRGFREKCDSYNSYEGCYECDLGYKQGNIGEQIESLKMALKALKQEPCEDAISREQAIDLIADYEFYELNMGQVAKGIQDLPPVIPQPKTGHWNNHQIACMLADLFGDACACNYNGIDEWLSELCDFKDTCCPNPVGVACWEQFLKYYQSRYTESEE